MPSLTVENYLKAVLQISTRSESDWVGTGQLAQELGVAPGTVTSMLKNLAAKVADGEVLVEYRPYEGVRLTDGGRRMALRMLRRHRLIELFLVETLDLTWDQVHEEAEHMEHAVSDFLVDRIDEYLGRPAADPHGDPIPSTDGVMRGHRRPSMLLVDCEPNTGVRIVRVTNQDGEFLRFLSDRGVEPGVGATVRENSREAGIVTVEIGTQQVTLGDAAAEQIYVESIGRH